MKAEEKLNRITKRILRVFVCFTCFTLILSPLVFHSCRPSAWRTSLQTWRAASCCGTGRVPSSARRMSSSPWTPWTACPRESRSDRRKQSWSPTKPRERFSGNEKVKERNEGKPDLLSAMDRCRLWMFSYWKKKNPTHKHCSVLLWLLRQKYKRKK